jgi:alpha-mannosidase
MAQVDVVESRETIFFGQHRGRLCQWILVTLENRSGGPMPGAVMIEAGGEQVRTDLELALGVQEYRCFAPVLWPDKGPTSDAMLRVEVEGNAIVEAATSVGHHRPWTVYLLSDVCTDYAWVYDDEATFKADDAALTAAEMGVAEAQAADRADPANRNHYNLVHARQVEFYLDNFPADADRLFEHIRRGTIQFNPFFNMFLTGVVSPEELIRHFYPARAWALGQGLDMGYGNHQETPAITWAMATVLAGMGVQHLVRAMYPYECPWVKRLQEPPIYHWEGPDGSRVLVRRRNTDYVEGNFVLRDLRATNTALHTDIIPRYEAESDRYPFDAIALLGCYGDLARNSPTLPAKKAATIAAYNAQGWEYPKLVNASHKQFWDDIDRQFADGKIEVPVYRGDYGAGWEPWPACMAYDFAGWRRAGRRAMTADALAAIASRIDPEWYSAHRDTLHRAWMNLIYLHDHAWNGANDGNRALNASARRQWQLAANRGFDAVIAGGLEALARRVPGDAKEGHDRVLVFNDQSWNRSGVVRLGWVDADPGSQVVDVSTGMRSASQVLEEDGRVTLCFQANNVPSVGYRVYAVDRGEPPSPPSGAPSGLGEEDLRSESDADSPWITSSNRLEGPFYAVEVSPVTGGIASLYDRIRGCELVDPGSPYDLNQCLYLSDGIEHTPRSATVEIVECGPVFGQVVVRAALKHTTVKSTITLYAHLDRVDIRNDVEKTPTSEKQELHFAFPFNVPGCSYRYEAPGAIVDPRTDYLPGAGLAVTAVRHFVDVFNDECGVTLLQADTGLVQLGGRRTWAEDPQELGSSRGTVLSMALENTFDWHEAVRDQAGISQFVFRYALRGHGGGFDPVPAVRFAVEAAGEDGLQAIGLAAGQDGDLPAGMHSFLTVAPHNVVLTSLKVAEEEGLIARFWDCAERDTQAEVATAGLGSLQGAEQTDLMERNGRSLATAADAAKLPVRARGLATLRLLL